MNYTSLVEAIASAGLGFPTIIHDRIIHRFTSPDDKAGSNNCWYVSYGTAGAFGSWKLGMSQTWSDGKSSENPRLLAEIHEYNRQREADLKIIKQDTAREARQRFDSASRSIDHPYPTRKRIIPSGARQADNMLLVPMFYQNALWNIQRIYPDGAKRFLKGGRVTGSYHPIGNVTDHLLICEGWATGCTLHEKTGLPVAVAFNAGNLKAVALSLRKKYPSTRITVACDNDVETEIKTGINSGLEKGREAAAAVGGDIIYPIFDQGEQGLTDFNDYVNGGYTIEMPKEKK